MNPLEYPEIHFKLKAGRVVTVDSFVREELARDVSDYDGCPDPPIGLCSHPTTGHTHMAANSKICKLKISLSDIDRNHYDSLNLTVAQHPSETIERMMVRILVFCINAGEGLEFTKGLSAVDEPDIWARSLDDQLLLWIDVGEPSPDRIKKASRIAREVKVYSFNRKSSSWWEQGRDKFAQLKASFYRFEWQNIQSLAALYQRTMQLSVTITGNSAYVATELGECEVSWVPLQG